MNKYHSISFLPAVNHVECYYDEISDDLKMFFPLQTSHIVYCGLYTKTFVKKKRDSCGTNPSVLTKMDVINLPSRQMENTGSVQRTRSISFLEHFPRTDAVSM